MKLKLVTAAIAASMLVGCASNSKVVPRGQAYKSISFGTVTAAESVTIGGSRSGIGGYVTAAAAIQDATSRSFFGFIARGLVGSAVGSTVEEVITRKPGMRYTVDTAKGRAVEIVSPNLELKKGDCVQIAKARRKIEISLATSGPCGSPVKTAV